MLRIIVPECIKLRRHVGLKDHSDTHFAEELLNVLVSESEVKDAPRGA